MSTRHYFTPFALAAVLIAASGAAFAQTATAPAAPAYGAPAAGSAPNPGTSKRGHRLDRTLATLGLSSDQEARIRGFRASYQASQSTATPETRKALVAQIRGVLTPDQLARFKTAMHHHHHVAPAPVQ